MSVSLITACKDREECLQAVLPSWLQHKEINEIIIVDWSSKKDITNLISQDTRIKVITVKNEDYYIPSQANNLAAHFATGEYILRLDADYFLNPYFNFFESYIIDENSFVSGDPESSKERENNPYYKYLFGLLYVSRNNFLKVGGYDESIGEYYSHEDTNIFARLTMAGIKQIKLKNNHSVIHIPHSDKKRFENFKGGQNTEQDEFTTVEFHIGKNLELHRNIKHFYSKPVVKWSFKKVHEQIWEAKKNKGKLCSLPRINCISLEESVQRRENLKQQFNQYGITDIHFITSKRFFECNDVVKGAHANLLSDGHKGCSISHLKMIKNWYETTTEPYGFFCEDDLSLKTVQFWEFNWSEFVESLPNDWEGVQLLYLKEHGDIKHIHLKKRDWHDWSVTCYILKRDYAKVIIDTFIKNDCFCLELPNPDKEVQPLIENILFLKQHNIYSIPLFIENVDEQTTFLNSQGHNNDLHYSTHYNSHIKTLKLWKDTKKDKIVDFFTFYEPLGKEMLELRINMLKDYVDEFVICESSKTQSGNFSEFKLKNILKNFNFQDVNIKVIELQIPDDKDLQITSEDKINCYENNFVNSNSLKARARERLQKDALLKIIKDYPDNTVFIHSDIDEIINPKNINFIADIVRQNQHVLIKIPLVHLEGRADLRVHEKYTNLPKEWTGMFFATKQHLQKATPTQLRSNANNPFPINFVTQNGTILKDLGWHFSWMGNADTRKIKCQNFTHYDDNFSFLITSKYKEQDTFEFQDNISLKEGEVPPSGDKNLILKKYPISNLPYKIFELPHIEKHLLPNLNLDSFFEKVCKFALNVDSPISNMYLGYDYFLQGHTAPALSYFLRCAERTDDKLLAYEALIYGYFCYKEQKIRDETAKSLIMHAVCLMPERPEARFLLSVFYEHRQEWMYSYYHACCGLEVCEQEFKQLQFYKDYPGKLGLLFQKALAGYWWGKNEECKTILLDLYKNYNLNDTYKKLVKANLLKLGIENV